MEFAGVLRRGSFFCLILAGLTLAFGGAREGLEVRAASSGAALGATESSVGESSVAYSSAADSSGHSGSGGTVRQGRLRDALEILIRTTAGRAVVARAQRYWKAEFPERILDHLRWGKASKTDAVITRYYNTATGEERRERQVVVFLKAEQRLDDLVLDLAHELVHATTRPAWDPYDPELTPARYIHNAIEGEGGEADAVEAECRVSLELRARFGTSSLRCEEYATERGTLDRTRILSDFYRVGRWHAELDRRFGSELKRFPLLSGRAPRLFSSTGQTPYPVALSREYDEITDIACRNARKRRALASRSASGAQEAFLKSRCGG